MRRPHLPRSKPLRWLFWAFVAFLVLAVALVGFAFLPERIKTTLQPPKVKPQTAWYVALGDSYTAAPALERQVTDNTPPECFQSDAGYPFLVARAIDAPSLTNVSCSGAFIRHLTQPQWTKSGTNAAQADALSAQTKLVTVGISGNDSMLLPLFFECVGEPHSETHKSFCVQKFKSGGRDEFKASVEAVQPQIRQMLELIRRRAPNAAVYVVGYPQITPDDGTECPDQMPFTAADLAYLDSGIVQLNRQLREAAVAAKMHFVETWRPSYGLGVCAPVSKRWIESVVPVDPAFAMHPNARGERGIAKAVIAAIRREGVPAR